LKQKERELRETITANPFRIEEVLPTEEPEPSEGQIGALQE